LHPFIRVGYNLARCPNLQDHFNKANRSILAVAFREINATVKKIIAGLNGMAPWAAVWAAVI